MDHFLTSPLLLPIEFLVDHTAPSEGEDDYSNSHNFLDESIIYSLNTFIVTNIGR
jgi:hypothetical protein